MDQNTIIGSGSDINLWTTPERVAVNEFPDAIEFIYKQQYLLTVSNLPPAERVFKIIFSCKEGAWHKSNPIYGKIIPATEEMYTFPQ